MEDKTRPILQQSIQRHTETIDLILMTKAITNYNKPLHTIINDSLEEIDLDLIPLLSMQENPVYDFLIDLYLEQPSELIRYLLTQEANRIRGYKK